MKTIICLGVIVFLSFVVAHDGGENIEEENLAMGVDPRGRPLDELSNAESDVIENDASPGIPWKPRNPYEENMALGVDKSGRPIDSLGDEPDDEITW